MFNDISLRKTLEMMSSYLKSYKKKKAGFWSRLFLDIFRLELLKRPIILRQSLITRDGKRGQTHHADMRLWAIPEEDCHTWFISIDSFCFRTCWSCFLRPHSGSLVLESWIWGPLGGMWMEWCQGAGRDHSPLRTVWIFQPLWEICSGLERKPKEIWWTWLAADF